MRPGAEAKRHPGDPVLVLYCEVEARNAGRDGIGGSGKDHTLPVRVIPNANHRSRVVSFDVNNPRAEQELVSLRKGEGVVEAQPKDVVRSVVPAAPEERALKIVSTVRLGNAELERADKTGRQPASYAHEDPEPRVVRAFLRVVTGARFYLPRRRIGLLTGRLSGGQPDKSSNEEQKDR